jgi:DNA-binding GntR family transcriptional regulator
MRRDIREGKLTVTTLDTMLEKELKERYGVSRDTARKSRAEILSEEAMRRDIREGKLTPARLREMRDEELEERYGVSCGKARDVVLSEFVEESNHDK